MTQYLLDSSAQAVRIFYNHPERQRLETLLDSAEQVFTTRFARYEFYHTWFLDGLKLFSIAMESDSLGEINQKMAVTHEHSSIPRMNQLLGFVQLQSPEETNPKMIAARIRMLIEDEVDFLFTFIKPGQTIEELDQLNCNMLTDFENHIWFQDIQGQVFPDIPEHLQCSRLRARCQISNFVKNHINEFQAAITAHENATNNINDSKFIEYGKQVLSEPAKAKGKNCSYISDWLMIAHTPENCTPISIDKHWQVICAHSNIPFIKLNITPEFDKKDIRRRMSAHQIKD